jgi:uncharacterized protein (TIGR00369 family)
MADVPMDRAGWFWDMVEGHGTPPPAIATLGFAFTSVDRETGEVEGTFVGKPEFANMLGGIQGGFLAAMIDVCVSCALLATLPAEHFAPTLELKMNYLRIAPIGSITGRGRVVHRGGTIAFLAGELYEPGGELVTTATATARIVRPK